MKVLSINLSKPIEIDYQGRKLSTGIYKNPVNNSVAATKLGLEGDGQADRNNHGGADKAIYIYSIENYRYWEQTLSRSQLPYGQFGENLTVEGMADEQINIGDIFAIGTVRAQVTQPRVPCFKLGIKMEMTKFPKMFINSGRVGFYLRVLKEGVINPHDPVTVVEEDAAKLSIQEAMLALLKGPRRQAVIKKALGIDALSKAWRDDLEKRLKYYN